MNTLKVSSNGTVVIPKNLRSIFRPSDKIVYFAEGDTLILKKVIPPVLSKIADRAKGKPLSLKSIIQEIHAYRQEKRCS